jgi:hypothetical protein
MYAKCQIICEHRYLWTINLVSRFLEFCTKIYCVKVSLVNPTVKSGSRGFIQNLFCKFWTFLQVSMNFGSLKQLLLFKTIRKMIKSLSQYWAETGPRLQPTGRGGLLCAIGWNSREAAAWRLGPAGKTAHSARGNGRAPRGRSVVTARGPRVWWRAW